MTFSSSWMDTSIIHASDRPATLFIRGCRMGYLVSCTDDFQSESLQNNPRYFIWIRFVWNVRYYTEIKDSNCKIKYKLIQLQRRYSSLSTPIKCYGISKEDRAWPWHVQTLMSDNVASACIYWAYNENILRECECLKASSSTLPLFTTIASDHLFHN